MDKLKVYLDTSVISYLYAEDTPEKMKDTKTFWKDLCNNKYDVFTSTLTIDELENCKDPKRTDLLKRLRKININILAESEEIIDFACFYFENNVLSSKCYFDCLHMSFATNNFCDLIISWNFKHLVNYNTIKKIKLINKYNNLKEVDIISPTMIIEEVNNMSEDKTMRELRKIREKCSII